MEHAITQHQQILDLALRKGLVRSSDLNQLKVSRVVLARMSASSQLEKISRGLYRLPDSFNPQHDSLLTIAAKVPQAVICLVSALQFYELTTQLPREVWIAMPRGSHVPKIDYPPIKMVQYSGGSFTEGMEVVPVGQLQFKVYNVDKTIVDCFKHRNKIGIDVAIEALKEARRKRLIDMNALWHYAEICRMTNLMRPYLEATE
jgi:predicted transcriptional regulator of viral defense system